MAQRTDLLVHGKGTIFLLRAMSHRGRRWMNDNVSRDRHEWNGVVVVEHRFIADILGGAVADGLRLR
jgi:hypothetical protein